jgi:hypothetical protein
MRRWDKEFEKTNGRKPTDADHGASSEFGRWQQQLRGDEPSLAQSGADRGSLEDVKLPSRADPSTAMHGGAGPLASAKGSAAPDAAWWRGNDYHELLRARVQSQSAVNGFVGASSSEVHAGATMFSHWDLDRDGVVGAEEFALVVNSLAQHAGRSVDADTVQRLLALVDCDGNGKIDLNEWLAVSRTPLA